MLALALITDIRFSPERERVGRFSKGLVNVLDGHTPFAAIHQLSLPPIRWHYILSFSKHEKRTVFITDITSYIYIGKATAELLAKNNFRLDTLRQEEERLAAVKV